MFVSIRTGEKQSLVARRKRDKATETQSLDISLSSLKDVGSGNKIIVKIKKKEEGEKRPNKKR